MHTEQQLQSIFHDFIKEKRFQREPLELYAPINYTIASGGKRLRPILLLMSYELFGEEVELALPAAFAIEIFHNFSLIHDDIMDKAPLRRGRPSVPLKYGVNTGILSGDVMLIYAYQSLLQYEEKVLFSDLVEIFNRVGIEVCEGQQYDMNFESQPEVSLDSYMRMIDLKTAALVKGAMQMGARIAGANKEDQHHIAAFGRNIGIAFQLQDDILDTFGDPKKFGKKLGGDIVQNKKTFLVLKSLEIADEALRQELQSILSDSVTEEMEKIRIVTSIFGELGVENLAERQKDNYLADGFKHLEKVNIDENRKKYLQNLANHLMERQK